MSIIQFDQPLKRTLPPLSAPSAHIRLFSVRLNVIPSLPHLRNHVMGLLVRIVAQHRNTDPRFRGTCRCGREVELVLPIGRDHILHVSGGVGRNSLTHALTLVVQQRLFDEGRVARRGMVPDPPFLAVPVVEILAFVDLGAELVSIARVPALLLLLLHPAQTLGRQEVRFGGGPGRVEGFQLATRAGPGEGVAFVVVVVVVVEAVVVAVVLSVDRR